MNNGNKKVKCKHYILPTGGLNKICDSKFKCFKHLKFGMIRETCNYGIITMDWIQYLLYRKEFEL